MPLKYLLRGRVDEFLHARERHDLVEARGVLTPPHAKNRSNKINVFAPREFGMNPVPTSKRAPTRPKSSALPVVGAVIWEISCAGCSDPTCRQARVRFPRKG